MAIIVLLAGCGGVKNAATIAGAGTVTYQSYDEVQEVIASNLDIFSPREIVRLRSAALTISELKAEIQELVAEKGSAVEVVTNLSDIMPLYKKAKVAYVVADKIITARIDEFDTQDQMVLYTFQESCRRMDTAINESLAGGAGNNAQTVKDVISFVLLVGKIVLPLVVL